MGSISLIFVPELLEECSLPWFRGIIDDQLTDGHYCPVIFLDAMRSELALDKPKRFQYVGMKKGPQFHNISDQPLH